MTRVMVPGAVGSYRCADCGQPAISRKRIAGKRVPKCETHSETLAAARATTGRDATTYLSMSAVERAAWNGACERAAWQTMTSDTLTSIRRLAASRGMGGMTQDIADEITDLYVSLIVRSATEHAGSKSPADAVAGPFTYRGKVQTHTDLLQAASRAMVTLSKTAASTDPSCMPETAHGADLADRVACQDLARRILSDPARSDAERVAAEDYLLETVA